MCTVVCFILDCSAGSHGNVLGTIQISSDYNPRLKLYEVNIVGLITRCIGL